VTGGAVVIGRGVWVCPKDLCARAERESQDRQNKRSHHLDQISELILNINKAFDFVCEIIYDPRLVKKSVFILFLALAGCTADQWGRGLQSFADGYSNTYNAIQNDRLRQAQIDALEAQRYQAYQASRPIFTPINPYPTTVVVVPNGGISNTPLIMNPLR
jgi:hypothetical protein